MIKDILFSYSGVSGWQQNLAESLFSVDTGSNFFGIGNSSPLYRLDVSGNIACSGLVISGSRQVLASETGQFTSNGDTGNFVTVRDARFIAFSSNLGIAGSVQITGNLGVGGTSSPLGKLHITNSSSSTLTTGIYLKNPAGSNNAGISIDFDVTSTDNVQARISAFRTNAGADFSSALAFHVNTPGGGLEERMRIDTSGNVGIATSSPTQKLDVSGNAVMRDGLGRITIIGGGGASSVAEYYSSEANPRWSLGRDLVNGGAIPGLGMNAGASGGATLSQEGAAIGSPASRILAFYTANGTLLVERARIDGNGYLFTSGLSISGSRQILASETGQFAPAGGTGAFVTSAQTGNFVTVRDARFLGFTSNVGIGGDLDATGSVTIGTFTSPPAKLNVAGTTRVVEILGNDNNFTNLVALYNTAPYGGVSSGQAQLRMGRIEGVTRQDMAMLETFSSPTNSADGALAIYTRSSSALVQRMVISGGSLGIGTATPLQKLDVSGRIACSGLVISGSRQILASETGQFAPAGGTGNFVSSSQTGEFVTVRDARFLGFTSNVGVGGTLAVTGNISCPGLVISGSRQILASETGQFAPAGGTGTFVTSAQTGNFVTVRDARFLGLTSNVGVGGNLSVTGAIGIGTGTPAVKLHVLGAGIISGLDLARGDLSNFFINFGQGHAANSMVIFGQNLTNTLTNYDLFGTYFATTGAGMTSSGNGSRVIKGGSSDAASVIVVAAASFITYTFSGIALSSFGDNNSSEAWRFFVGMRTAAPNPTSGKFEIAGVGEDYTTYFADTMSFSNAMFVTSGFGLTGSPTPGAVRVTLYFDTPGTYHIREIGLNHRNLMFGERNLASWNTANYFTLSQTILDTTESSSPTVGALAVHGGLGVSKNIRTAKDIYLTTGGAIYGDTTTPYLILNQTNGTQLGYSTSSVLSLLGSVTTLSAGANYLGLITNGTERFRINSAGNIGINNTSPSQRLDVSGYIASSGLVISGSRQILASETGQFAPAGGTGTFVTSAQTGDFVTVRDARFLGFTNNVGIAGSLNVTGNITGANFRNYRFNRVIPTGALEYVYIGDFVSSHGGHNLLIGVTVDIAGYSVAKQYNIVKNYDTGVGEYSIVNPIADSNAYLSNNFRLEASGLGPTLSLRLTNLQTGSIAGTAIVDIFNIGTFSQFTESTVTGAGSSANTFYDSAQLTQVNSQVGIGTSTPQSKLDVSGVITSLGLSISGSRQILASETGQFAPAGGTGNFVSSSQTGEFVTVRDARFLGFTNNVGVGGTLTVTGNISCPGLVISGSRQILASETGQFAPAGGTGNFVSSSQTGEFVTVRDARFLGFTNNVGVGGSLTVTGNISCPGLVISGSRQILASETGQFVADAETGNFVTVRDARFLGFTNNVGVGGSLTVTGNISCPGLVISGSRQILASETGQFVADAETGNFVTVRDARFLGFTSNVGVGGTLAVTGNISCPGLVISGSRQILASETGQFAPAGGTGSFVTSAQTGNFVTVRDARFLGFTSNVGVGGNLSVTGDIGIGTGTSAAKLDVNGTSIFRDTVTLTQPTAITFQNGQTIRDNSAGGLRIQVPLYKLQLDGGTDPTNGLVEIKTSGLVRMTVTNSGNVGINTTSPSEMLEVAGNILINKAGSDKYLSFGNGTAKIQSSNSNGNLDFAGGTSSNLTYRFWKSSFSSVLAVLNYTGLSLGGIGGGVGAVNALDIIGAAAQIGFGAGTVAPALGLIVNGSVGIGSPDPQGALEVYRTGVSNSSPLISIRGKFSTSGNYGLIRFGDYTQTTNFQKGAIIYEGVASSARGKMHIALENSDGTGSVTLSDARLTVLSNGNVGIGTTTPVSTFEVTNSLATQYASVAILARGVVDPSFTLRTLKGETTNASGDIASKLSLYYQGAETENASINFHRGQSVVGGFLSFATNTGAERMRIDTLGHIGINTRSPNNRLDVSGYISCSGLSVSGSRQVLASETGQFAPAGGTGTFISSSQTGDFVTIRDSRFLAFSNNIGIGGSLRATGDLVCTSAISASGDGSLVSFYMPLGTAFRCTSESAAAINYFDISNLHFRDRADSLGTLVYMSQGGNIGIGTSVPSYRLSFGTRNDQTFALFENASGANLYGFGYNTTGTNRIAVSANGSEAMSIVAAGNVGINTTNPSQRLDVSGYIASSGLIISGSRQILASETGQFAPAGGTGNFVSSSQTGEFVTVRDARFLGFTSNVGVGGSLTVTGNISCPGLVISGSRQILASETGQFVADAETGNFVTVRDARFLGFTSNVGVGGTLAVTGNISCPGLVISGSRQILASETGQFAPAGGTGNFVSSSQTGNFVTIRDARFLGFTSNIGVGGNLIVTGNVGVNISTPPARFSVSGITRLEQNAQNLELQGSNHTYLSFFPRLGSGRAGYFGYAAAGSNALTIINELPNTDNLISFGNLSAGIFISGNKLGLNASDPRGYLHIRQASSNSSIIAGSNLIVESNTSNYINLGTVESSEAGTIFAKPSHSTHGAIVYNAASTPSGFQFRTNGNLTRMAIDKDGDVGIGTVLPTAKLHINSSYFPLVLERSSVASWGFELSTNYGMPSASGLSIFPMSGKGAFGVRTTGNSGNVNFFISENDSVGIGTTAPGGHLHVRGSSSNESITVETTSSSNAYFQSTNALRTYLFGTFGSDFFLYDASAAVNRLVVNSAGSVSINNNSPTQRLDVSGYIACSGLVISGSRPILASETGQFAPASGAGSFVTSAQTGDFVTVRDARFLGFTNNVGVGGSLVVTGNVGIGVTDPAYKLDINGPARVSGHLLAGDSTNTLHSGASFAAVIGGYRNYASGGSSVVLGGNDNTGAGNGAVILGGAGNSVFSADCSILGGFQNTIFNKIGTTFSAIVQGQSNSIYRDYSFIGAGRTNVSSGRFSAIIGGESNLVSGDYTFAAGVKSRAIHPGAFVLSDSRDMIKNSPTGDSLSLYFQSGVYITGGAGADLRIEGRTFASLGLVISGSRQILASETGQFAPAGGTGAFVTSAQTGNFVTVRDARFLGFTSNVGVGGSLTVTGNISCPGLVISGSRQILASETGQFVADAETGNFVTIRDARFLGFTSNVGVGGTLAVTGVISCPGLSISGSRQVLASETGGFGGSPGGSNTQIQFNDGGVLGGDADFTWDKPNNQLKVGGFITVAENFILYPGPAGTVEFLSPAFAPLNRLAFGGDGNDPSIRISGSGLAIQNYFGDFTPIHALAFCPSGVSGTANQILGVGNNADRNEWKTLVAGTNVTITHAGQNVTIAAAGGSAAAGGLANEFQFHSGSNLFAGAGGLNYTQGIIGFYDTGELVFGNRSRITSSGDGSVNLQNNARTDFTKLTFGNGNHASYPGIFRNGSGISIKNSNNAGFTELAFGRLLPSGVAGTANQIMGMGNNADRSEWKTLVAGTNVTITHAGQNVTIAASAGSATPGGANTQIQFNDSSAFGGDSDLTWDKTNNILTLGGDVKIQREAANIFAFRNGTNTQSGRIYRTYASSTEWTRANIGWTDVSSVKHFRIETDQQTTTGPLSLDLKVNGSFDEIKCIHNTTNLATFSSNLVKLYNLKLGTDTNAATYRSWLYAATVFDFASIAAGASEVKTVPVASAVVGDIVWLGLDDSVANANICFTAWVSATDTVSVRARNLNDPVGGAAIDLASATYKIGVIQS